MSESTLSQPEAASPEVPVDESSLALVWLAMLLPLGILTGLYGEMFVKLWEIWDTNPNYSHGFVVPFASIAFAYMAWQEHGPPIRANVPLRDAIAGWCTIAFGLVLYLPGWFAGWPLLEVLSLIFILRGLLRIGGGSEVNKYYGFAALFLIFMAPLPTEWYRPLAVWMQEVASNVSDVGLQLLGIVAFRQGNIIYLEQDYKMEVGEACSGLRQLTAIIALSVALGHLSGRSLAYKLVLVALAIPIAILGNCIRVLATGLILVFSGPTLAEGVWHTLEGLATVIVSSLVLVGVAYFLGKLEDSLKKNSDSAGGSQNETNDPTPAPAG